MSRLLDELIILAIEDPDAFEDLIFEEIEYMVEVMVIWMMKWLRALKWKNIREMVEAEIEYSVMKKLRPSTKNSEKTLDEQQ